MPPQLALLLMVSDSKNLPAAVRSAERQVRHWGDSFGGDPADPATWEWTRGASAVTAVIDLHPPDRARAALAAIRRVRPDAAVLLLSQDVADVDGPGDGTLARSGGLRDVVRLDLEEELARLEAERRGYCLREFAAGDDVVPILIHDDPDPDAMSSALAVRALIGGTPERMPIVTLEEVTRPENRRMADLLHIRVTRVTCDELRQFDRVITVDTQPRGLQQDGRPRLAVIDHHPAENSYAAEFRDIRPHYGATATMLTEYLRAASGIRVRGNLATALLYGIRTDTDSLARGVTPADVAAYAYLQEHADVDLIKRFERPSYTLATARSFADALRSAECDEDLCVAYVGELQPHEAHVLADLADFCLGIENITWVAVAAELEGELVLTLRHTGSDPGAGGVARALASLHGGSGGGHATMARVAIPAVRARTILDGEEMATAVRRLIREAIRHAAGESAERSTRRDSPQARPA
ncbi:MAG: DHH family phosphoesterase [Gemmatimonadota bacterium]